LILPYRKRNQNRIYSQGDNNISRVDLIILANYEDTRFCKRGIWIDVKRGELAWSEKALAARWQWSRGKVDAFLEWLKTEHQIEHQKTKLTTLISIVNYEKYQNIEQQNEHQTGQQNDIKPDNRMTHRKNIKNTKNIEEDILKEKNKKENPQISDVIWPFSSERFLKTWDTWIQYRNERKIAKYQPTGLQACLKMLAEDSEGDEETAIKMIENAIAKSWQGIFPLKNQQINTSNGKAKYSATAVQSAIFGDH
jgi:hypothetical protein